MAASGFPSATVVACLASTAMMLESPRTYMAPSSQAVFRLARPCAASDMLSRTTRASPLKLSLGNKLVTGETVAFRLKSHVSLLICAEGSDSAASSSTGLSCSGLISPG